MNCKRASLVALLGTVTVLTFTPKVGSEGAKNTEVSLSLEVTITSRYQSDWVQPKSEDHEQDQFRASLHGSHRWTLEPDSGGVYTLHMSPEDYSLTADGAGSFARKGEGTTRCNNRDTVYKYGEERKYEVAFPSNFRNFLFSRLGPQTNESEKAFVEGGISGFVGISMFSKESGKGQYRVSFPFDIVPLGLLKSKGEEYSWSTQECKKVESKKPFESEGMSPSLGASASHEAGDDAAFMANFNGSFDTTKDSFMVVRNFSYEYRPKPEAPSTDPDVKSSMERVATLRVNYALTFGAPPDHEAEIIQPDEYATWQPEAGNDEATPGNSIQVKVRIHKKDKPEEQSVQKAKFKFELLEVSQEKGVCLNWPPTKDQTQDEKQKFDLRIDPMKNPQFDVTENGQSATTKKDDLDETTITITSYDWGAYGKVMATAIYKNEPEETAHLKGDKSKKTLTIPKDENNNHIADFWEDTHAFGDAAADDDSDFSPHGDGDQGDGLSLYEEYRGFHEQGAHISTSPLEKDLFICDHSKLGLGDYFGETGLVPHLMREDEFESLPGSTNPWVINFNRGYASKGAQHLIYMKNECLPGLFGKAIGSVPGPPKVCEAVTICRSRCLERNQQELSTTIAHELSHCCNLDHHGDGNYKITVWEEQDKDGKWIENKSKEPKNVAAQRGEESGVQECIMRYDGENFYERPDGPLRWKKSGGSYQKGDNYGNYELSGYTFCNDQKGTGVNAEHGYKGVSKAGDAVRGECQKWFCVNDTKH